MFNQVIRCTQYDLMISKAKSGQIYFCTDTQTLYKDNGPTKESRSRFPANVLFTEYDRTQGIKPTIGKYYYVIETNCLWLYDSRWILKLGNENEYNTYSYDGGCLSPVISDEETVTGAQGDIILDNNGLLGNGAVVVRDVNRIVKGNLEADNINQQIRIKSYMDNGLTFIPNANLPYNNLDKSYGALHLTTNKMQESTNDTLNLYGEAHYYGTWNNYGDMYITVPVNIENHSQFNYTPTNKEIMKIHIVATSKDYAGGVYRSIKSYVTIQPTSATEATINIIQTYNDDDANSVIRNDQGDIIFTNTGNLLSNTSIVASRKLSIENGFTICKYYLEQYNETITIKTNNTTRIVDLPYFISSSGYADTMDLYIWRRNKLITEDDLEAIVSNIIAKYNK